MQLRAPIVATVILASLAAIPAFALPGEAAAVIQRCGKPSAEEQVTSPVTNRLERNLYYGDALVLHFQPLEGGWSFTTAWHNHLPMTRDGLEALMPCFKSAMQEAAAAPLPVEDPTIANQTAVAPVDDTTFGIPHLWLIVVLVVFVLAFMLIPARKRVLSRAGEVLRARTFRKPVLRNARPPDKPRLTEID